MRFRLLWDIWHFLGSVQNDMAQFGSVCILSWQFLAHSHQSRDKFTFSLLKGFILCREGQQSTETHTFSAECAGGGCAPPPYIHTVKVTGLQLCSCTFPLLERKQIDSFHYSLVLL